MASFVRIDLLIAALLLVAYDNVVAMQFVNIFKGLL